MGNKKARNRPTQDLVPRFHPIEALPGVAMLIDGEAHDAAELWESLEPVRRDPFILDEECVGQTHRLYSEDLELVGVYQEQLARWSALDLTRSQRAEVERLQGQVARYRETALRLVALTDELRGKKTIEALRQTDDLEVGRRVLSGEIPWPRPRTAQAPPAPRAPEPLRTPPGVEVRRYQDDQGRQIYEFHHRSLGRLGRLTLIDLPQGGVDVRAEMFKEPAENLAAREALFMPLGMELIERLQRHAESRESPRQGS